MFTRPDQCLGRKRHQTRKKVKHRHLRFLLQTNVFQVNLVTIETIIFKIVVTFCASVNFNVNNYYYVIWKSCNLELYGH